MPRLLLELRDGRPKHDGALEQDVENMIRGLTINPSVGAFMNRINPAKLRNSKWTAVTPLNREKHFMVTEVEYDEDGSVISCVLEAVLSRNEYPIEWTELKDVNQWLHGWR